MKLALCSWSLGAKNFLRGALSRAIHSALVAQTLGVDHQFKPYASYDTSWHCIPMGSRDADMPTFYIDERVSGMLANREITKISHKIGVNI